MSWICDINETQNVSVNFPIIADDERKVSELYDFIHPNASATATVRSLVIIAPDKTVKLIITYPASTGRNFVEVLRVVDSLQLTANYSVATPANWQHGEDVIVVPSVSTEDAINKFPKGVKVVKPYLRYTPQPDLK
jgi:alkyl hydroperoxide reductase subunit AhpC